MGIRRFDRDRPIFISLREFKFPLDFSWS
jgi:hypothetical protein